MRSIYRLRSRYHIEDISSVPVGTDIIENKKSLLLKQRFLFSGAPGGIRTLDLPVRSRALYPLSYKRIPCLTVFRSTALTF